LQEIYGCEEGSAVQYLGDVVTNEGRLLTFPNILQHRVGPFSLLDKTKPGHRKILALFLIDPHIRVISTANVPCQRKDWWEEELRSRGAMAKLPNEIIRKVTDNVNGFPMSFNDAKELWKELMEERSNFVKWQDQAFESAPFHLCEH
jgi:Protein of unknown function (DUF4246)